MRSDIEFWASKFLVPWLPIYTEPTRWARKIETYDTEMIPTVKREYLLETEVPFPFLVGLGCFLV